MLHTVLQEILLSLILLESRVALCVDRGTGAIMSMKQCITKVTGESFLTNIERVIPPTTLANVTHPRVSIKHIL